MISFVTYLYGWLDRGPNSHSLKNSLSCLQRVNKYSCISEKTGGQRALELRRRRNVSVSLVIYSPEWGEVNNARVFLFAKVFQHINMSS